MAASIARTSGGRTTATFLRAGLLGREHEIWILTFNFKTDYGQIFAEWCARHRTPSAVSMKNFYEALAGESIYHDYPPTTFLPPADARPDGQYSWTRSQPDGIRKVFHVRDDGSLWQRDTVRNGVLTTTEHFDPGGRLRLKVVYRDGKARSREYFTDNRRRFLMTRIDDQGRSRLRVEGGNFDTGGKFLPAARLQRQWISALERERERVVFVLDDRTRDLLVLDKAAPLESGAGTRRRAIAVIHGTHLSPPQDDVHRIRPGNGKVLVRKSEYHAAVVLTHEQARDIAAHFGDDGLTVIPHPIRLARARKPTRRVGKRVVVAGRLVELKRYDHMIRAFALVAQDHPDAELHIWGHGDIRGDLAELARELGQEDRVAFRGYTTDVASALRSGVVGLSTSRREGIGLSTIEALSAGLPVVSYDYKYGPRDLINEGRNGFIVPDGDFEALAERISWLLSHPVRRRIMGMRARLVQLRFRPRHVRRQWLDLLGRIE